MADDTSIDENGTFETSAEEGSTNADKPDGILESTSPVETTRVEDNVTSNKLPSTDDNSEENRETTSAVDPAIENAAVPTNESEATVAKKKPDLKLIGLVAILIIAALVGGIAYSNAQAEKKAQEEAAAAEKAAKEEAERKAVEAHDAYVDDLELFHYAVINGAANTEDAGNRMLQVWRLAIYEENRDAWPEEARPYFATDFNEALDLLFADENFKGTIESIKTNQQVVAEVMRRLSNPPEDCKSAYNTAQDLYLDYKKFTDLVVSINGSYSTVSDSFAELDSAVVSKWELLETQIPEKIGTGE